MPPNTPDDCGALTSKLLMTLRGRQSEPNSSGRPECRLRRSCVSLSGMRVNTNAAARLNSRLPPLPSFSEKCREVGWKTSQNSLAHFGLDAIDLRWTLKDIAAQRTLLINKQHVAQLIDLGLVEMRDNVLRLTISGQNAVWPG